MPAEFGQIVTESGAVRYRAARLIGNAVDDDEIGIGIFLTNGPGLLVLRAPIAGKGCRLILEFDHDVAFAGISFHRLIGSPAYDEFCSELLERRRSCGEIFRVSLFVPDRDAYNPISFRQCRSPSMFPGGG